MTLNVSSPSESLAPSSPPIPEAQGDSTISRLAQDSLGILEQSNLSPSGPVQGILSRKMVSKSSNSKRSSLKALVGLTFMEDLVLKKIFKDWHLGSEISLQSLLGLELDLQISLLEQFIPVERIRDIRAELSSILFAIRKRYNRNCLESLTLLSDKFFTPLSSSQQALLDLATALLKTITTEKNKRHLTIQSIADPIERQTATDNLQSECEQNELITKRIRATLDVFIKISKNPALYLLVKSIFTYEGTEHLDHPLSQNDPLVWQHLQRYVNFCKPMKGDSEILSPFEELAKLCDEHDLQKHVLTKERLVEMRKFMHELQIKLVPLYLECQDRTPMSLQTQASEGVLSKIDLKNYESILVTMHQTTALGYLISEFQYIFDCRLVAPDFPDFCPVHISMQRFLINMGSCPNTVPQHDLILEPTTLPERFQNYLSELIAPIEESCGKEMLFLSETFSKKNDNGTTVINSLFNFYNYKYLGYWLPILVRLAPSNEETFSRIKEETATIAIKLEQFLTEQAQALPPSSDEERQTIILEMQRIYWEKTLFLRRLVMVTEDLQAITKGLTILDQYIPWELSNVMTLDRLNTLFWPPVHAAEEEQPEVPFEQIDEAVFLEPIPSPIQANSPAAAAALPVEEVVPKKGKKERKKPPKEAPKATPREIKVPTKNLDERKEPPVKKETGPQKPLPPPKIVPPQKGPELPTYSVASPEILNMTMSGDIIKALYQAGFRWARQKGSHVTLKDRFGRTVVVPHTAKLGKRGKALPTGTVYAIYSEATAPIRSK